MFVPREESSERECPERARLLNSFAKECNGAEGRCGGRWPAHRSGQPCGGDRELPQQSCLQMIITQKGVPAAGPPSKPSASQLVRRTLPCDPRIEHFGQGRATLYCGHQLKRTQRSAELKISWRHYS